MAYSDPQLLHLDAMLTSISVGYQNEAFVADQLAPAVNVEKKTDKYYVQELTGVTEFEDMRAPSAPTNELPPMSLSRDSYSADEHALKDWVSRDEIDEADNPLSPMADAVERVSDTILLNREAAIVGMVTNDGNFASGSSTGLTSTDCWDDYENSDPITDLKTARDTIHGTIIKLPTVAIFGYAVGTVLEDHPKFLERIKTSPLAMTTLQMIGELTGVPRLVKASAMKNTAAPGQTPVLEYMWGNNVVVAYVPFAPARKTPAFMYEFNWRFEGQTMPSDRWYDTDRKSWAVRTTRRYDLKFVALDSTDSGLATGGYLITDVLSQGS